MSTSSESESLLFQWQTFSPSLSSHLSSALASGRLSDVTLLAAADSSSEPRPLRAHRLVLAAGSDFFRRLFESPSFSSAPMTSSSVVVLADVDPEDLTALVSFLYCGEARVESGRLETFLKAARNLKIHGLEQASTRKRSLQVAESRTSKVTKRDTGQEAENQENNDEGTEVKVKAEPESLVIQADPSAMDDVDEEEGDGVPCSPPRDPQQKSEDPGGNGELVVLFSEEGRCHFCRLLCPDRNSLKKHLRTVHQPPKHALCENCENFFHVCAIRRHEGKCAEGYRAEKKS